MIQRHFATNIKEAVKAKYYYYGTTKNVPKKKTKSSRSTFDFWPRNGRLMEDRTLIQFVPREQWTGPFAKKGIGDYNELALGKGKIMCLEDWIGGNKWFEIEGKRLVVFLSGKVNAIFQ